MWRGETLAHLWPRGITTISSFFQWTHKVGCGAHFKYTSGFQSEKTGENQGRGVGEAGNKPHSNAYGMAHKGAPWPTSVQLGCFTNTRADTRERCGNVKQVKEQHSATS